MQSNDDRKSDLGPSVGSPMNRRQVLTGVALGAGVAALVGSPAAKAHSVASGVYNVKVDGGAIGNGVADDTSKFQAAINSGLPVYVPPGTYRVVSTLTVASRSFVMYGDGPDISMVYFEPSTASNFLNFSGRGIDQLMIRNLGISASGSSTTFHDTAINAQWSWTGLTHHTVPSAFIENVVIGQNGTTPRFNCGIHLHGGQLCRILNCSFFQIREPRDAIGILITATTDGPPGPENNACETQVVGCYFLFQGMGIAIVGFAEGTRIANCSFVSVIRGIWIDGTPVFSGSPQAPSYYGLGAIFIQDCHFDFFLFGVDAQNVWNFMVRGSHFLLETGAVSGAACIKHARTNSPMLTGSENALYTNNIFYRNDNTSTVVFGIYVNGASADNRMKDILIDANRFCNQPFTHRVYLDTYTTRIRVTGTNLGNAGQGATLDLGTANVVDSPSPA